MESFTIKNLTFSYPEQEKKVIDDVSFSVGRGEFLALCGPSGCGKTTLLRQLKTVLTPHGKRSGEIFFEGMPLQYVDQRTQSSKIGFVMQSPDNQIVTDKVWHELAFGLESLGFDTPSIRIRVAEMASFFGIQNWFYKNVTELSGGQKQLLNLASIMAMQPSVLILDEPTGQLDPISAGEFLATVGRINRELGTTVIMTEHRLEEVLPLADRALVLDHGKILADGTPKEVGKQLKEQRHSMFLAMPVPMRIYAGVKNDLPCPITVREGRTWLNALSEKRELKKIPLPQASNCERRDTPAVEFEEIWFRYEKDAPDVLKGLSMKVYPGEFFAILGGNGTGKTTALSMIPGINKPYRGTVKIKGHPLGKIKDRQLFHKMLGVLPQNPQALFVKKTVKEDLLEMLSDQKLSKDEKIRRIEGISELCRLEDLLSMHPYDLSGGEQQRAALAKVLLLEPKILLLDEPTKGIDSEFKQVFAQILHELSDKGVTIIMVSHDIEFCAKYAHRCAMFFDGNIVSSDEPRRFFSGNSFYTTAANRMARYKLPEAVTTEDVIVACGGDAVPFKIKISKRDELPKEPPSDEFNETPEKKSKLPRRRLMLVLAALAFFFAGIIAMGGIGQLSSIMYGGESTIYQLEDKTIWRYVLVILIVSLGLGFLVSALRGPRPTIADEQMEVEKRYLPKRTLAAMLMILLAIPLTIYIGIYYLFDRKYYFISLLIILETMLPFVLIF